MVCYVSDQPLRLEQISRLYTENCGLTPDWNGVAWVGVVHNDLSSLALNTLQGHYRIWGNVAIAGDPELLDRLEELFHQHAKNE
jgi:hypothetical protein